MTWNITSARTNIFDIGCLYGFVVLRTYLHISNYKVGMLSLIYDIQLKIQYINVTPHNQKGAVGYDRIKRHLTLKMTLMFLR